MYSIALLRGTIVNRTYGTHENLYIYLFLLTILVLLTMVPRNTRKVNAFIASAPFWGQTTQNLTGLSPKRDCRPKRTKVHIICSSKPGFG